MDNYLKISSKLYNLRKFLERSQGDMFERKMYLTILKVEDELGITQCYNCGRYEFTKDMIPVDNSDGGVDLHCDLCAIGIGG